MTLKISFLLGIFFFISSKNSVSADNYQLNIISHCSSKSRAYAINDKDVITGKCGNKLFFIKDNIYKEFPSFPASFLYGHIQPSGINNNGVIVGSHKKISGTKAFIYNEDEFLELDINSKAYGALDINNKNEIVGWLDKGGNHDSFILKGDMNILKLSDRSSSISAINDFSVSTGEIWLENKAKKTIYRNAFILRAGKIQIIPTLGGEDAWASDINNGGLVVGSSQTKDGRTQAFVYSELSGIKHIKVPNSEISHATAINDNNEIVGWYSTSDREDYIFIYKNGKFSYLGQGVHSKIEPFYPHDINNNGTVVGVALYNRKHVSFVLKPILF